MTPCQRLRLFNAVVGRSVLWGAESWYLTLAQQRSRRAVERQMFRPMPRRFASSGRRTEEDYLTWIRRATREAISAASDARIKPWLEQMKLAKWRWAGHVIRKAQYEEESWDYIATRWRDASWQAQNACERRPLRSRAGRWGRWEDDIMKYCRQFGETDWITFALDKTAWEDKASHFAITTSVK